MNSLSGVVPELDAPGYQLIQVLGQAGLHPEITSTVRSHATQARLYRRYLAGESQYPAAPPGQSAHEYGLAFDLVVTPRDYQNDVGALWQSWGGAWGGLADPVHFELPGASEWARQQPAITSATPVCTIYDTSGCTPELLEAAWRRGETWALEILGSGLFPLIP